MTFQALSRLIEVVITFIICHENEMQKYFGVGCLFFSTSLFFLSKYSTISVRSYQAYNTHTQNSCVYGIPYTSVLNLHTQSLWGVLPMTTKNTTQNGRCRPLFRCRDVYWNTSHLRLVTTS